MRRVMLMSIALAFGLLAPATALRAAEEKMFVASVDESGVQKVEVVAGSYLFDPNHIVVKAGVPVELKLRKEGGIIPHDFTLEAPEAGISVHESLSTDPKTVQFTPTKAGSYTFYCSHKLPLMKSHREQGMEGVLEVRE